MLCDPGARITPRDNETPETPSKTTTAGKLLQRLQERLHRQARLERERPGYCFLTSPIALISMTRSCAISSVTTESCAYAGCFWTNSRIQVAVVFNSPLARLQINIMYCRPERCACVRGTRPQNRLLATSVSKAKIHCSARWGLAAGGRATCLKKPCNYTEAIAFFSEGRLSGRSQGTFGLHSIPCSKGSMRWTRYTH